MFEYVINEEKKVVNILKEKEEIGTLNYEVRGNSVCVDVYKMPFTGNGAKKVEFDEYFAFFNKISKGLEAAFDKKVVLGVFSEVKELDNYATKVDETVEKQPVISKGKR